MKKYRLLNVGIYGNSTLLRPEQFPIVVEAEVNPVSPNWLEVPADEINRIMDSGWTMTTGLTWFNSSPFSDKSITDSWEELNPFEQWNALKASREVGAMPAAL